MTRTDKGQIDTLIAAAMSARDMAYAPYSNHPVGVAIMSNSGKVYSGCNVENAAYPLGFCGEANAIGNMILGGDKVISHVVIAGPGTHVCTPCGGCRQQLREFAGESGIEITICDKEGSVRMETSLAELLPHSFGPDNVGEVAESRESTNS